jgi:hypothetical protein
MARARKSTEPAEEPEQEQSEQEQREAAREAAGQGNQDQENAPTVEQTPQPDTRHFIAQPDAVNEPEGIPAGDSYDETSQGPSVE